MQRVLGCLAVLVLPVSAGATVAPSAYLTIVWVEGQTQAERYRQAFPGAMLVEHRQNREAQSASRSSSISGMLSGSAADQPAQSGERLGEVFFEKPERLLGLPPTTSPAPQPQP